MEQPQGLATIPPPHGGAGKPTPSPIHQNSRDWAVSPPAANFSRGSPLGGNLWPVRGQKFSRGPSLGEVAFRDEVHVGHVPARGRLTIIGICDGMGGGFLLSTSCTKATNHVGSMLKLPPTPGTKIMLGFTPYFPGRALGWGSP